MKRLIFLVVGVVFSSLFISFSSVSAREVSTGTVSTGSVLAVLEYHPKGSSREKIEKFTDRLREEFIRRGKIATLSKAHTEEIFSYHRTLIQGSSPYQARLSEAKQAYYELRLPEAKEILKELIRLANNLKGRDDGTLLESWLLLGLTLAAVPDEAGAREAFGEALRLNPRLQINQEFFPPKIVKLFRNVLKERSFLTSTLAIQSRPLGGKVYVNGVFVGVSPLELKEFPVGTHAVRVEEGPRTSRPELVPLAEKPVTLHLSLGWRRPAASPLLGFSGEKKPDELVQLASQAGSQLGVQKVLLVSLQKGKGELKLVDSALRAPYQVKEFDATGIEEQSAEISARLVTELTPEIRSNLLVGKGATQVADRFGGDMLLLGHYHRPLYKRPLFWVVVGLAGAGGGIGAAVVGGAGAAGSLVVAF